MTPRLPSFPALWRPRPDALVPQPGAVVLVVADLGLAEERLDALRETFSARDEQRFQSFGPDDLRKRWGAARGTLREVLAAALGCAPTEVEFRYGAHGKPRLAQSPLRFNISHSGAVAL